MKTQKLAAILGVAALALGACGGKDKSGGGKGDYTACLVSDSGGWDDKSFNQSAKEGLDKAVKDLGVKSKTAESKTDSDFTRNVEGMVGENCNLVMGVGFKLSDAISASAKDNADINYSPVDSTFKKNLDNERALVFNTHEAAYLAGYAAAARVVWHQYQIASGKADEGGQRRAFVAAFVFFDLNDDFHAFFEHVLNTRPAAFVIAEIRTRYFLKRQKAVAVGSVIHETRFQRRLDTGDDTLVNITFALLFTQRFDVQIQKVLPIDNGNAQLFGLRCIEQHSFHNDYLVQAGSLFQTTCLLFVRHSARRTGLGIARAPFRRGMQKPG